MRTRESAIGNLRWAVSLCLLLGACLAALGAEPVTLPVGGGQSGVEGLAWVRLPGVEVQAQQEDKALRVAFSKSGEERRLLALEARPAGDPSAARSLAIDYSLALSEGQPPRLAFLAFGKDGGVWLRTGVLPLAAGEAAEARLPLQGLREAAFSQGAGGAPDWANLRKVWLGFTFDGQARGTLVLRRAVFTSEPYRPSRPLPVPEGPAGVWQVSKDPAARATVTTPSEAPGGKPCARFDFSFPGGRHMYMVPSVRLPGVDLEGFGALRFRYKARLPKGIGGLLVMLIETNGAQYHADPAPGAAADWTSVTIPFERFRLGVWSKDPDGRLDLGGVAAVAIGIHGAASEGQASGSISVADIEFLPAAR